MNREAELFEVFKKGIKEEIIRRADNMSDFDDEAQQEYSSFNNFNSDLGGGACYDDLSDSTQRRLEDEAGEGLLNELEDIIQDGNDALEVIKKIIRGLV